MTVILWATVAILTLAAVLGIARVMTATDDATRAVVGDLVYFCAVGVMIMMLMATDSAVTFDVALIAALLGILSTIALSRILTRGRR
ncbi:MAG: monovalent cation/H+ antiporter complex subunit F [Actinomycetota bacterium]|jgi:multicomponent Na+:H+ antiporter subunit F|nr:monovalent cation/H+ antiporter complex subunit F [Actinomycetota bacterium]